jgi:hypothetical protein
VDVTANGAPPAHSGIEHFEGCTKLSILPLFLMEGIESQASAVVLACVSMFTGNGAKKLCGECVHTCHVCVCVCERCWLWLHCFVPGIPGLCTCVGGLFRWMWAGILFR